MQLGTFGAILTHAIELEEQAVSFYESVPEQVQGPFGELAQDSRKRLTRLERARREGVTEMILEPITGLDSEAYQLDLGPDSACAEPLQQARAQEELLSRFYQDAADKLPIREVEPLFRRLARASERRREKL